MIHSAKVAAVADAMRQVPIERDINVAVIGPFLVEVDQAIYCKVDITLYRHLPSTFPGGQLSREVNFPRRSTSPGGQLSREVNFPGKLTFLGSQLSREVNFSWKSTFPGSQCSQEVNFSGKSTVLGSQCSRIVNSKSNGYRRKITKR